jgi:hypothetical protein
MKEGYLLCGGLSETPHLVPVSQAFVHFSPVTFGVRTNDLHLSTVDFMFSIGVSQLPASMALPKRIADEECESRRLLMMASLARFALIGGNTKPSETCRDVASDLEAT